MLYRSLIALTVVAVGHAVPTRDLAHQSVHTLSVKALADLNPAKTKVAIAHRESCTCYVLRNVLQLYSYTQLSDS